MFSEDVTFFVYLGYMSLAWGLVLGAALLVARFIKTWLINALVNFHAMRGDIEDEVEEESEVERRDSVLTTVIMVPEGPWGSSLPPVVHPGLHLHRSRSQPARLVHGTPRLVGGAPRLVIPPPPTVCIPDLPPLYHEVMDSSLPPDYTKLRSQTRSVSSASSSACSEVPPPQYWDLYPSPGGSLVCVQPVCPVSSEQCGSVSSRQGSLTVTTVQCVGDHTSITTVASTTDPPPTTLGHVTSDSGRRRLSQSVDKLDLLASPPGHQDRDTDKRGEK